MSNQQDRMELAAALLAVIEQHRERTGDRDLGFTTEKVILEQELRGVEHEIYDNPGALESMLVPIRVRR